MSISKPDYNNMHDIFIYRKLMYVKNFRQLTQNEELFIKRIEKQLKEVFQQGKFINELCNTRLRRIYL